MVNFKLIIETAQEYYKEGKWIGTCHYDLDEIGKGLFFVCACDEEKGLVAKIAKNPENPSGDNYYSPNWKKVWGHEWETTHLETLDSEAVALGIKKALAPNWVDAYNSFLEENYVDFYPLETSVWELEGQLGIMPLSDSREVLYDLGRKEYVIRDRYGILCRIERPLKDFESDMRRPWQDLCDYFESYFTEEGGEKMTIIRKLKAEKVTILEKTLNEKFYLFIEGLNKFEEATDNPDKIKNVLVELHEIINGESDFIETLSPDFVNGKTLYEDLTFTNIKKWASYNLED